MCGIWFLANISDSPDAPPAKGFDTISNRGPDSLVVKCWTVQLNSTKWLHVQLACSVLHMQGTSLSTQPAAVHVTGTSPPPDVHLAWNGELYHLASQLEAHSDTQHVASAVGDALGSADPTKRLLDTAQSWQGPWAMLVLDMTSQTLWFARDAVGRRSLLSRHGDGTVSLSSAACEADLSDNPAAEVQPGTLFRLDLRTLTVSSVGNFAPLTPARLHVEHWSAFPPLSWRGAVQPGDQQGQIVTVEEAARIATDAAAMSLLSALSSAVHLRVCGASRGPGPAPLPLQPLGKVQTYCGVQCNVDELPNTECAAVPPAAVAVMFSGGIDCMLIAALAHRHVPLEHSIDLINVAFSQQEHDGPIMQVASPDRDAAVAGLAELQRACPGRRWRLICVNEDLRTLRQHQETIVALNHPRNSTMDFSIAAALWCGARGVGWVVPSPSTQPPEAASTASVWETASASSLADNALSWFEFATGSMVDPPSERLNPPHTISEDNPGVAAAAAGSGSKCEQHTHGDTSTCDGVASSPVLVRSAARVVLLGMGADEQCGGYGRHLTAFAKGREVDKGTGIRGPPGWEALQGEMDMDVQRIWQRNLGRDDRVVSDHGREARFPFLDEGVMSLLGGLPLPLVTDARLPRGEGDKRIIRRAGDMLGLTSSSALVKRAIQFGSRVARVTNKAVVAAAAAASGHDASTVTGRYAMKQTRGSDAFGGLP